VENVVRSHRRHRRWVYEGAVNKNPYPPVCVY
jgi:hypothetical protein